MMGVNRIQHILLLCVLAFIASCAGSPKKAAPPPDFKTTQSAPSQSTLRKRSPYAPAQEDLSKRGHYTRGGLYAPHVQDSAPDHLPDVEAIPEPEVTDEARSRYGNRSPYLVLGKSYNVRDKAEGYAEEGLASYYGNKFHGRKTSNLEIYDMYAFTAAHKSLPLPSFARVTNLANGKSVVVRVNDRGPFHSGRIIDLSYAAAVKLDIQGAGTARVEVRGLSAGENAREPHDAVASKESTAISPVAPPILPVGVRIATGKPQRMSSDSASASPGLAASAIDKLVEALPIASAQAAIPAPASDAKNAASIAGSDLRFDTHQDGETMSANEFDVWMTQPSAHVATGKPSQPEVLVGDAQSSQKTKPLSLVTSAPAVPLTFGSGEGVTLQVAAFTAQDNAERALAMLRGAGISQARLQDEKVEGQPMWRLRIGPVSETTIPELTSRVAGLGFGQPRVVR